MSTIEADRGLPAPPWSRRSIKPRGVLWLGLCALLVWAPAHAVIKAGHTLFARGAVMAQQPGGGVRLIGSGMPVYEGDVLTTARRSYAIIHFEDGTKMTMRPETVFTVDKFSEKRGKESLWLRLFKGGMRAITGLVSRRNSEGFKIRTAVATIGIRGTDFTARFCDASCAREAERRRGGLAELPGARVAGRMAFVRGTAQRTSAAGAKRRLVVGTAVFEGDILETGSHSVAVLAFRDATRVTLQAGTRFQIERLRYKKRVPQESSAFLRLLRGGLRIVTGLIGKTRPKSFQVATPVATIGIRGTGFDLVCQGDCVSGEQAQARPAGLAQRGLALIGFFLPAATAQAQPTNNGLFVLPWLGTTLVNFNGREIPLNANQNAFFRRGLTVPVMLPSIPPAILNNLGPRPDSMPFNPKLFDSQRGTKTGLQVDVRKGGVEIVSKDAAGKVEKIYVAGGEAAQVAGGEATLVTREAFMVNDPFTPSPADLNAKGEPKQQPRTPDSLSCQM